MFIVLGLYCFKPMICVEVINMHATPPSYGNLFPSVWFIFCAKLGHKCSVVSTMECWVWASGCSSRQVVTREQVLWFLHRKLRPRPSCSRPRYSNVSLLFHHLFHPKHSTLFTFAFLRPCEGDLILIKASFFFQLAMKGPPGPLGLRGRPGPLVGDLNHVSLWFDLFGWTVMTCRHKE